MNAARNADVVVVGAGTGGLTVAAYLAVAGRRVVVVDRGQAPGGCGSVFARDGYEFDVGLHYLGSTPSGQPAVQGMLEPLGVEVGYRRVDPVDTLVLPEGDRFEVPAGLGAYRERLHDSLPGERASVDKYLDLVQALEEQVEALQHLTNLTTLPRSLMRSGRLLRHVRSTLGGVFDDLRLSPRARTLLGWITGVYAVPPSEASLLMHALASLHYLHGAWYPEGGGAVISERLADVVRDHRGEVLLAHEVTRIRTAAGEVRGVLARGPDGADVEIAAPVVVSDADLKRTLLDLVDNSAIPARLRRRTRGYEMALPLGVLYAVLDRDLAAEGNPATNFLVVPDDDLEGNYRATRRGELPEQPWVWVSSPSLKDPGNPRLCRPGQTNLQMMTVVPPQPSAWGLEVGVQRGEAYQAAKRRLRDRMLAVTERAFPGLSDAVVFEDVATPYTLERYLGSTDGTSYGIAATPDQMLLGRPGPKTPVKGLFLVGASTRDGHGITGVMSGGITTASAVLGTSALDVARSAARPPRPRVPA